MADTPCYRDIMEEFASLLSGGDRRSTGNADLVADVVKRNHGRFGELWTCLGHADPTVRMRAADALEKVTRSDSTELQTHKDELLSERFDDGTPEVRWHLLALSGRLQLGARDARKLLARLQYHFGTDSSRIVRVMALQAAADLEKRYPAFEDEVDGMICCALASAVPSLQARAKNLLSSR